MVFKIPPPTGDELDNIRRHLRRQRWVALFLGVTLVGVNSVILTTKFNGAPPVSFGAHVFDAALCVLNFITIAAAWRPYLRTARESRGRNIIVVTGSEELCVMTPPRSEGQDWRAEQIKDWSFWNFPMRLFPPKGRGATPGRAVYDMWSRTDARFGMMPEEDRGELYARIDHSFFEHVEQRRGPLLQASVE